MTEEVKAPEEAVAPAETQQAAPDLNIND